MKRARRNLLALAAAGLILSGLAFAQRQEVPEPSPPPGGPFTRIFHGNYTSPLTESLEARGQETLADLVRDGKIRLAPEDAVRLALEHNVDINVERFGPYLSMWDVEKARGVLNATLSLDADLNRTVTPSSSALQGGTSVLNLQNLYNFLWHKPLSFGMDVDLNYNTQRMRGNSSFLSLNPSLQPGLGLTLTQHLLRDFGRVSRTRFIKIARNNYGISEETFVTRTTDIIASVLNTYWDLVYAEEDIKLKEESRTLAQLTLDQNKIQAEVGTMAPLDVVQAEAEVAARDEDLVNSRFARKTAEERLKKMLSSQVDPGAMATPIEPLFPRPFQVPLPSSSLEEAIQRALEIRPEIRQLQLQQENNKIQIDYTHNQLRPILDFSAGYSQTGLGGDTIIRDYSKGFIGAPIIGRTPGGFPPELFPIPIHRSPAPCSSQRYTKNGPKWVKGLCGGWDAIRIAGVAQVEEGVSHSRAVGSWQRAAGSGHGGAGDGDLAIGRFGNWGPRDRGEGFGTRGQRTVGRRRPRRGSVEVDASDKEEERGGGGLRIGR